MREVGASWVDVLVVCGVRQRQRNVFFLLVFVFLFVVSCFVFRVSCFVLCSVVQLFIWWCGVPLLVLCESPFSFSCWSVGRVGGKGRE